MTKTKDRFPDAKFDVRWRPYELNSALPKGAGVNKMEMYKQKFGEARIQPMIDRMAKVARDVGIEMSYGGNVGNTFDSHRLVWYAFEVGGAELQDKVINSIFQAYFEEEKCLSDHDVLKDCAERASLDAADLLSNSELGLKETRKEMSEFARMNRGGVPLFILNRKYSVSGAQESDVFIELFEDLLSNE